MDVPKKQVKRLFSPTAMHTPVRNTDDGFDESKESKVELDEIRSLKLSKTKSTQDLFDQVVNKLMSTSSTSNLLGLMRSQRNLLAATPPPASPLTHKSGPSSEPAAAQDQVRLRCWRPPLPTRVFRLVHGATLQKRPTVAIDRQYGRGMTTS